MPSQHLDLASSEPFGRKFDDVLPARHKAPLNSGVDSLLRGNSWLSWITLVGVALYVAALVTLGSLGRFADHDGATDWNGFRSVRVLAERDPVLPPKQFIPASACKYY